MPSLNTARDDELPGALNGRRSMEETTAVPPLGRIRFRDIIFGDNLDRVEVQYFDTNKSFKERLQLYFIENRRSSFYIRMFNVLIKIISCILYCVRVIYDPARLPPGIDSTNSTPTNINLNYLIWVDRGLYLWLCQTIVGTISLVETLLIFYISYKGNVLRLLLSTQLLLEVFTSVPFIVTSFLPYYRELFVPVFLNCWLAKTALQAMLNDLNRATQRQQSALAQQMLLLLSTLLCLLFTSTCGIQHLQRSGGQRMGLFTSFYFIVVTFSTVGYGEYYPDYILSQLFVVIMICIAFAVLPSQIEKLGHTWIERQKSGGEYSKRRAKYERHVVVTVSHLLADSIMDFLNEFYAHPKLQDHYVILLSPCELDIKMRMLLQIPLWADRVIYIRGSALKDNDLERARMGEAESCFILSDRNNPNKAGADEHTILRSWAVKDFAPKCPQYVQIFRPETKMHVKHADYIICEDEFKYSLLANNCVCPGISTFITLLLHTSRGEEGQRSTEPWHKVYGRHSGNEIYHIRLGKSKLFGEYEGKSFTYASYNAHRKYGVALVGVKSHKVNTTIQLNPGQRHTMRADDICYYMALTEEELSSFHPVSTGRKHKKETHVANTIASIGTLALELQHARAQPSSQTATSNNNNINNESANKARGNRKSAKGKGQQQVIEEDSGAVLEVNPVSRKPSIGPVPETYEASQQVSSDSDEDGGQALCPVCGHNCIEDQLNRAFPPVTPYVGTSATVCHLTRKKREHCCLMLTQSCAHYPYDTANQYDWANPAIVLAADRVSNGLYNFIIPLRAHYRPVHELNPIVLLLEERPDDAFLDTISWFPLVYWLRGSMSNLDNMLKAGICLADHVVLVKEGSTAVEEHLADCNTIVTAQKAHRLFPGLRVITELTQASNMRFMQFNAKDLYALHQSKFEKKERERGSHMAYMFRLPFASGSVFSANMLDTLLYQAFVKDYLVQFVRLLLGIDQAVGSGFLTSFKLTEDDMWIRTYGRLYQKICSSEADIPIGLLRTKRMDSTTVSAQVSLEMEAMQHHSGEDVEEKTSEEEMLHRRFSSKYLCSERHEITNLVRSRMQRLGLPIDDYAYASESRGTISFVIINPAFDMHLESGDVVYVLKAPKSQSNIRGFRMHPRRGLRRHKGQSPPRQHCSSIETSSGLNRQSSPVILVQSPVASRATSAWYSPDK